MGGVWGHGGVPTHVHMHVHAHMDMYTCIEIANGHPMEASMFIMFTIALGIHAYMHVHVYVCLHGIPPFTPTPIPIPIH